MCVCGGEGIGSVSIWKTRAGWAGLVQTLRAQLGERLMKFQPFAAWLHGEAALLNHLGAVPGIPGEVREPWGAQTSTSTHLAMSGPCWWS